MNLAITFHNFIVTFIDVRAAFFYLFHQGEQKMYIFLEPGVVFLFKLHHIEEGIIYFVVLGHLFL